MERQRVEAVRPRTRPSPADDLWISDFSNDLTCWSLTAEEPAQDEGFLLVPTLDRAGGMRPLSHRHEAIGM
jgi:hypothetical protein